MKTTSQTLPLRDPILITIVFSFFYFLLAWVDHIHGNSGVFDLGIYDQVFYQKVTNGTWYSSFLEQDIFKDHFSLVLWLLAPFYNILPHAGALLFFQSMALGISCAMAYTLAIQFYSRREALIWTVLFSFFPSMIYIAVWDFHPLVFVLPLLMTGILFETRHHIEKALLFYLATLLVREDMGVIVAGIGLFWCFQKNKRGEGILLIIIGSVVFLWVTQWMAVGNHGQGLMHWERYSHLGSGIKDVIFQLWKHPIDSLAGSYSPKKLLTLLMLIGPYLGLPILGVPAVLNAIPGLALNYLSQVPNQFDFRAHYMVTLIPFIYGGALMGAGKLLKKRWNQKWMYGSLVAVMALVQSVYFCVNPISSRRDFRGVVAGRPSKYLESLDFVIALADVDQPLVVSNALGAQITRRSRLYLFGKGAYEKELDKGLLIEIMPSDPWPMHDHQRYGMEIKKWCDASKRHVVYQNDHLILLLPGPDSSAETDKIRSKMDVLIAQSI